MPLFRFSSMQSRQARKYQYVTDQLNTSAGERWSSIIWGQTLSYEQGKGPFCALYYLIPFLVLLLTACGDGLETREETNYLGYRNIFTVDPETGLKMGEFRQYDTVGNLLELAHFKQGVMVGQRVLFSATGDTAVVENYLDFKVASDQEAASIPEEATFAGDYRTYYEDGQQIKQQGQYLAGAMHGQWKKYYPNGQLAESVTFADNEENGPFEEWYENGQRKATGQYLDGDREHGQIRLFTEDGTLERVLNCDRGICRTIWRPTDNTPAPDPE
ncbi:MAG: hypothetical protein AAF828_03480 [Bacteroidota bacterium]